MRGCSGFTENRQGYLSCRTGAKGEGEMIDALSALQYPHWLMVVVLGFIGLVFRQNGNASPDHETTEMKANGK
jgi:hypothetical protein